jgi:hypothetical protein
MKNEKNNMITKFEKLFEELEDIIVNIENDKTEYTEQIKHNLSIITYKRKNSPKPIRILDISGYYNKIDSKIVDLLYNTYLILNLTNKDKIEAKLSVYKNSEINNIYIKINNELVYDMDNVEFNNEIFVDKLTRKYKEYILKNYTIR